MLIIFFTDTLSPAFQWDEKDCKLQEIIDNCPMEGNPESGEYNPPCNCDQFLTLKNPTPASETCDDDVKALITNEEITVTNQLPRGSCEGPAIVDKSWTGNDPSLTCAPTPCVDCNNNMRRKKKRKT